MEDNIDLGLHKEKVLNRSLGNLSETSLNNRQSLQRAKSLLSTFHSVRNRSQVSHERVDFFRLKDHINREFTNHKNILIANLTKISKEITPSDISFPINDLQNRILCVAQALCNSKYKTLNPDFTLDEFNVLEKHRKLIQIFKNTILYLQ